ncbi:hypothetical protein BsWGS_11931 [Bradybaena similaris]
MEHKIAILSLLVLVIQLSYIGVDTAVIAHPCPRNNCNISCPRGSVPRIPSDCSSCFCNPRPRPPRCGPVCRIYCPNGFVLNRRGCPICRCKPGGIRH